MTKTVPVSLRLSQEDAEFIAQLKMDDAITISDKIRSLIKNAKKQTAKGNNYRHNLQFVKERLSSVAELVKDYECETKQYSLLLSLFHDWLEEVFAFYVTLQNVSEPYDLHSLEAGVAHRVFRLLEAVMRMGVTSEAPCYDRTLIYKQIAPILELTELINYKKEEAYV